MTKAIAMTIAEGFAQRYRKEQKQYKKQHVIDLARRQASSCSGTYNKDGSENEYEIYLVFKDGSSWDTGKDETGFNSTLNAHPRD
jgi:hypothetical protein